MIRIIKNKKQEFAVAAFAINGELLSMSEGLSSRQKAKRNIESQFRIFEATFVTVIDETLKGNPKMFALIKETGSGSKMKWNYISVSATPRYIPGKNPKRKPAIKKK